MSKLILIIFSLSFLFSSIAIAQQAEEKKCEYILRANSVLVKWTAYKTPSKVGVGGSFSKVTMQGQQKGETILQIVRHSQFEIDATSLNTRDKTRDLKISKSFFETMKDGPIIRGKVTAIKEQLLEFDLKMNGVTVSVPMAFNFNRGTFKATGVIDVLDFTMLSGLKALTKVCSEKHKKKTWNDVNIEVFAKFTKKCN